MYSSDKYISFCCCGPQEVVKTFESENVLKPEFAKINNSLKFRNFLFKGVVETII